MLIFLHIELNEANEKVIHYMNAIVMIMSTKPIQFLRIWYSCRVIDWLISQCTIRDNCKGENMCERGNNSCFVHYMLALVLRANFVASYFLP